MKSSLDDPDNDPSPDDLLSLNIGGRTGTVVSRRTMTQFPESLLASHFSGRWKLPRDRDGNIFIDEDPDLFETLIAFLRSASKVAPHCGIPALCDLSCEMERLLVHYNLTFRMYPLEINVFKQQAEEETSLSVTDDGLGKFSLSTSNMVAFSVRPAGHHERVIRSFSVVLGPHSFLSLGWSSRCDPEQMSRTVMLRVQAPPEIWNGLRFTKLTTNVLFSEENDNTVKEDTLIRVEKEFARNGTVCAWSWTIGDSASPCRQSTAALDCNSIPRVGLIGTIHVTEVVYESAKGAGTKQYRSGNRQKAVGAAGVQI